MPECLQEKYLEPQLSRNLQKPEFYGLIRPWLSKAQGGTDPFESFIYLWVAFDAWMADVVHPMKYMGWDAALIAAAARDTELSTSFSILIADDLEFHRKALEFQLLWPVFNVRELDKHQIGPWETEVMARGAYRQMCLETCDPKKLMKPECYLTHQDGSDSSLGGEPTHVPLDWPHTLAAIYQVRCNLFHGGKSFQAQSDNEIVKLARDILWACWGADFINAEH